MAGKKPLFGGKQAAPFKKGGDRKTLAEMRMEAKRKGGRKSAAEIALEKRRGINPRTKD